ncbi:hypothetical protein H9638_10305 [Arthrobacter sp. Sa2BUA2]|uniref:Fis family transcriptional regulator n=1 Tax=Arthrobacter pullicola TaxID=2762224 RepID=A0ABR8YJ03_9MICC|nr:hypothetical protein [Arthrobacter pullicola]MBD8044197.1 hypothetical protein [Arthrobacter pullicola]
MRWEALFADLEAQLAAAGQSAREAEIADRQRGESAAIQFADRLRGQVGRTLKVHLDSSAEPLTGVLAQMGSGWLLLRSAAGMHLVPLDAVRMVEGMDRFALPDQATVKLGLLAALRGLARDRYPVHLQLRGALSGTVYGSIDRVGRDFLELAVLETGQARRRDNVATAAVVPLREIAAVSSRH